MVSEKFLRNDDCNEALAPERIIGVETGGCPHTAILEDASINLEAVARFLERLTPNFIVDYALGLEGNSPRGR